jgi:anti-sigma B factor antagonist
MSSANLSVLVGKNFICIRIAGRANFASSPDFKTLLDALAQRGFTHFIVDLTECVLMDSTFLGVLAGFGMKLNLNRAPAHRGIELHNATPRVTELLENLGAAELFEMTSGPLPLSADVQTSTPESINPTHEQIARTSLEAHQTLMAMNPENVARFKDVAQFLAEDLKNIE